MQELKQKDIIKVISFNLRRDFPLAKKNRWQDRKSIAAQLIKESGAQIIGVQELLPGMRDDVRDLLDNSYTFVGNGRLTSDKGLWGNEYSDILVNNDSSSVLNYKTFWLSNEPEKAESRGLLAIFPRICTVAQIYIKSADARVRVFNTHFDHLSGWARNIGVRIILDYIEHYNSVDPLPTILMGDLNASPKSKPVRILRENLHSHEHVHLTDVYTTMDSNCMSNTLHNFSGKINPKKLPIDYMFVSDEFEVVQTRIITDSFDGKYPSDHFPLVAMLRLKPQYARSSAKVG